MRRSLLILVAPMVVLTAACGSSAKPGGSAAPSAPTSTSPPAVAPSTTTTVAGRSYSSKAFVVPLTVTVDDALTSPPALDSAHMLSWDAAASKDDKIRFMVPVEVYRPGKSTPEAPPTDYLQYLQGFAGNGATLSAPTSLTVDGHPATLMNVTSTIDASHPDGYLDGAFGCPQRGADRSDGCFGPQAELLLRTAVVKVGDATLLIWARVNKAKPDPAFLALFERMLTTVAFR